MRIVLFHTHAYPGCRLRAEPARFPTGEGEVIVEFSDGTVLAGRYRREIDEVVLSIPAYKTARGTSIVAKRWVLNSLGNDEWKVARRLADGN